MLNHPLRGRTESMKTKQISYTLMVIIAVILLSGCGMSEANNTDGETDTLSASSEEGAISNNAEDIEDSFTGQELK